MNSSEFQQVSQRQGEIAARIFQIREQIDLHLQANDIDTVNKVLAVISFLESTAKR